MNPTLAPQAHLRERSDSAAREVGSDKTVTLQTSAATVMFVQRSSRIFADLQCRKVSSGLYYEHHCKATFAKFQIPALI
jgi:hypothetical protein